MYANIRRVAMEEETEALGKNKTWDLVEVPDGRRLWGLGGYIS